MRSAIAVLLVAVVAVNAKTRRPFPMPSNAMKNRELWNMPDEKIVGGTEAALGDIPHQVSFRDTSFGEFHFCGGSIKSANVIICAAHCVTGEDFDNPDNLIIVAGELDTTIEEGTEQKVDVIRIVQHENYNSQDFSNDISLLFLTEGVLNVNAEFVGVATMPTQGQEFTSGDAEVSGWGTLSSGGETPKVLMKVTVPIVDDATCNDTEHYGGQILDGMICSGEAGKDSCQGDSGGPMTCGDEKIHCGIVSWGYGCAAPNKPGVYTETSYFIDWMEDKIREHEGK